MSFHEKSATAGFATFLRTVGPIVALLSILFSGCRAVSAPSAAQTTPPPSPAQAADGVPVIADPTPDGLLPHSTEAFTQGLLFADGALFESTGRHGESQVRRLNVETGALEKSEQLAEQYFGEGLALFEGKLFQLTWTSQTCLIYDLETLEPKGELFYPSQGWGLSVSPEEKLLVFSDGSDELRFLDPSNLVVKRKVTVHDGRGHSLAMLNELEWVRGEIWANVWMTDTIARIDPKSGRLLGWLRLAQLTAEHHRGAEDVLNGIAYDPEGDRLWITGKLWPKIYRFDNVGSRFFDGAVHQTPAAAAATTSTPATVSRRRP